MRRLILRSEQSPGDVLMLTAAVRDLHAAAPGQFQTDVRTSAPALWENNPHLTRLHESEAGVETLDMHYPLIHLCNQRPYHFLHGYPQYLEEHLGLRIPVTRFSGDLHLTNEERQVPPPGTDQGVLEHFWIVMAGGKYDFTAKWWDPASYQEVVDHFRGRIAFVQCGEEGHWHPRLKNVIDLVGKTTTREFVRLIYHADGVLCPVTFAMHLAAAVPTKPGRPRHRPCVVVAGGREPPHWEAYPHHRFLSTVGTLPCCADGGCWKSRCQLVGDGDDKDRNNLCEHSVQLTPELRIPKCMTLITSADVIRQIEPYLGPDVLANGTVHRNGAGAAAPIARHVAAATAAARPDSPQSPGRSPMTNVLIRFPHGLGDAVQLGIVLRHLQKHHPDWQIDVHCQRGKHSALRGLCRAVYHDQQDRPNEQAYQRHFDLGWYECYSVFADSPCTKACNCLREVFGIVPELELCNYVVNPEAEDYAATARYLEGIGCKKGSNGRFNAVVLHYEGNTSTHKKNLSHSTAAALCEGILAAGYVPVILDWDRRSPLPDNQRIFCPSVGAGDVWGGFGSGDAGRITALIAQATLFVGIDSGPGKCAGATDTPSVIVWTGHHPIQFHDLCKNTTHFVPDNHESIPPMQNRPAAEFFARHYAYRTYSKDRLTEQLCAYVGQQLGTSTSAKDGLVQVAGFWCHADRVEQDWTVIEDVFVRDCYKTALLKDLPSYRVAVDVGAHIGTFSRLWASRVPGAKIIALECAPENLEPLKRNAGDMATVLHAACVGELSGPLELLNAFTPPGQSRSTGGSMLVAAGTQGPNNEDKQYRREALACERLTLKQVMARFELDHIDLLKLDCEGSEYAILDGAPLETIRFILGEYHGHDRWEEFRAKHFAGWDYGHMSRNGEFGNFHLRNPQFRPLEKPPAVEPEAPAVAVAPLRTAEANGHWGTAASSLARPADELTNDLHDLAARLEPLSRPRILVIGDLMVDRYTTGAVRRVSPEAPALILQADHHEARPGGAASVAALLRALDADVSVAGVVGTDADGRILHDLLEEEGVDAALVLQDPNRPTTVKERFLGRAGKHHAQQRLRVDRESVQPLSTAQATPLASALAERIGEYQAVLISDYGKGVCTPQLLEAIGKAAQDRGVPVVIDPARLADFERYRGATVLKPNRT